MPDRRALKAGPRADTCTLQELAPLVTILDRAFVTGRGRKGSLALRYPGTLAAANLEHIHVRRHGGRIIACCVARRFTWLSGDTRWQGAMIGMVYTAPAWRGRGHAAAVLDAAVDALAAAGVDFAVLWSGLDGFYERLGWAAHDRGILGSVDCAGGDTRPVPVAAPGADDIARYTALRARLASQRLERDDTSYSAIPLPAERVAAVHANVDGAHAAALVGHAGTTRYVFDAIGDSAALPALWHGITACATTVHVNEVIGSDFHRWLAGNVDILFGAQELTFWRMLSPRAGRSAWREWHLPWFDRI